MLALAPAPEPETEPAISREDRSPVVIREDYIDVDRLDFHGQFATSENGKFQTAWEDFDRRTGRGGNRDSGLGRYVLVDEGKLILVGNLERPHDARVANNGTFAINDWLFDDGLKGKFYVFDRSGAILLQHRFSANLWNTGISPDGSFAVCQNLGSDTEDAGTFCGFDVASATLVWRLNPPTGWAVKYSFDEQGESVYLHIQDVGEFRYSRGTGEFEDHERWLEHKLRNGNGFELSAIAEERMGKLNELSSSGEVQEVIVLFKTAINRGLGKYPNQRAATLRSVGELHERLGEIDQAVENFEKALKLNSNVGVKRRLEALKGSESP